MVAAFEAATVVDKVRLARSLIDQGCRYGVCAGVDCDDCAVVFDAGALEEDAKAEADSCVATCDRGESVDQAAEFLFTCTAIEERSPECFMILTVGARAADREAVKGTVARALAALPSPRLQRT